MSAFFVVALGLLSIATIGLIIAVQCLRNDRTSIRKRKWRFAKKTILIVNMGSFVEGSQNAPDGFLTLLCREIKLRGGKPVCIGVGNEDVTYLMTDEEATAFIVRRPVHAIIAYAFFYGILYRNVKAKLSVHLEADCFSYINTIDLSHIPIEQNAFDPYLEHINLTAYKDHAQRSLLAGEIIYLARLRSRILLNEILLRIPHQHLARPIQLDVLRSVLASSFEALSTKK